MRNFWQQILLSKIVFTVREILFLENLRHIQQSNKMQQTPQIPSAEKWGWGLCDAFQTTSTKTCWNLQVAANGMLFSFPKLYFSHCFLCIQTGNHAIVWWVINTSERSMTSHGEKLLCLRNSQFSFKVLIYCSLGSSAGFSTSSYFPRLSCNFGAGHPEYTSPFLSYSSHVFQKVLSWRL